MRIRGLKRMVSQTTGEAKAKADPPPGGAEKDLKFAAIFAGAGIVALIFGGSTVNVIGGIALLVGLVFLVRWIIRR
jgi:uncharacterized membrane protein